jgi:hypothetical protein
LMPHINSYYYNKMSKDVSIFAIKNVEKVTYDISILIKVNYQFRDLNVNL